MKWFSKLFSDSGDNASGELNAFLGAGTEFTGQLHFEGSVRIDGHFQGVITSPGTLILGHDAVVRGEVRVAHLNANGSIIGEATASKSAHMHEHSVFDGHLITPSLSMDEGAVLNGTIAMPRTPGAPSPTIESEVPTLPTVAVCPAELDSVTSGAADTEDGQ